MWGYTVRVPESHPLGEHIDSLWKMLKPHKRHLLKLKESLKVNVFLGYRSNCDTAGVEIPYQSLEMFSELKIPFGISIIIT